MYFLPMKILFRPFNCSPKLALRASPRGIRLGACTDGKIYTCARAGVTTHAIWLSCCNARIEIRGVPEPLPLSGGFSVQVRDGSPALLPCTTAYGQPRHVILSLLTVTSQETFTVAPYCGSAPDHQDIRSQQWNLPPREPRTPSLSLTMRSQWLRCCRRHFAPRDTK